MKRLEQLYVLDLSKQTRPLRQNIFKNPTMTKKKNKYFQGGRKGREQENKHQTNKQIPQQQQPTPQKPNKVCLLSNILVAFLKCLYQFQVFGT